MGRVSEMIINNEDQLYSEFSYSNIDSNFFTKNVFVYHHYGNNIEYQ